MIKAVIFDMDGVLIDSEPFHNINNAKVFSEYGIEYKKEFAHNFFGLALTEFIENVGSFYGKKLPLEELKLKLPNRIEPFYKKSIPLTKNAKKTLGMLNGKYKLALATSTHRKVADIVLKRLGISGTISASVAGDEIKNGKPNPEIFLKAAKLLGVNSAECIVIEDSPNGMNAVKAAKMLLIAYKADHNNYIDFSLADYVIEDLREIPKIIEKINKEY